jgi:serine acetyltransferase/GT2 family glycosyltransferase
MTTPRISVLIATYERHDGVRRLLAMLERQTLPPDAFEVIVVDDGSTNAFTLAGVAAPYSIRLVRQENTGPAGARHRAAQAARGELLVVLDDDMQIGPGFLAGHARMHPDGTRRVALGPIDPDPDIAHLSLFEQWNAGRLQRMSQAALDGGALRGTGLWTGNVSLRRDDYFAVGGFDLSLRASEDQELGIRLERAGVEMTIAPEARAVHRSDHADATWLRRASNYGQVDRLIARKHPDVLHADPWRYYFLLTPLVRPFLDLAVTLPAVEAVVARTLLVLGQILLALGVRRVAIRVAAVVYAAEYFRGVRIAEGSRRACIESRRAYLARAATLAVLPPGVPRRRAHWMRMRADLAADRVARARYASDAAESHARTSLMPGEPDVGLRVMRAVRLMIFFRDAGHRLFAMITSRVIRHLYRSDVHWDAQWGEGVTLIHGFGLAISHAARIGPGCVVFHNVCLGVSIDAETRVSGAPTLEYGVHVGPGATLVGPIVVGGETTVMPAAVLSRSVPGGSVVAAAPPVVRRRR